MFLTGRLRISGKDSGLGCLGLTALHKLLYGLEGFLGEIMLDLAGIDLGLIVVNTN